jgi:mono/diheme cytochrome c family protein
MGTSESNDIESGGVNVRKVTRVLASAAAVCLVVAAAALGFLALRKPKSRPPSAEKIEATPERLARGEYLARHVANCIECHSDSFFDRFGLPVKPDTLGQGGYAFDAKLGVPGVVQAQNITPDPETGLGHWTDGEILRAMREGVDREGRALFPQMPYPNFRFMSDEDARAIVVFLRTLPPIRNAVAPRRLDFPVNLLIKGVPAPVDGPVSAPPRTDSVAYGKYLVTIAGCAECHTPHDSHGAPIAGRELTGGWEMRGPWGRNVTPNLTPDKAAYLGRASRDEFIGRFQAFQSLEGDGENAPIAPKGRNTVMPWLPFSRMTREDLGAIYDYLKTVRPVSHQVEAFPDAPAGKSPVPSGSPVVPSGKP